MELILFAMISLVVVVALLASRLNDNSFPLPSDSKNSNFTPAEKQFQNLNKHPMETEYGIVKRSR